MNLAATARYIARRCAEACDQAAQERTRVAEALTKSLADPTAPTSLAEPTSGSVLERLIAANAVAAQWVEIHAALDRHSGGDGAALDPLHGADADTVITATRTVRDDALRWLTRAPQQLTGLDAVYDHHRRVAATKFLSTTDVVEIIEQDDV